MLIDRRMNDFSVAFHTAFTLIGSFDAELRGIVFLSLAVAPAASACAFAIGAPLGTALAVYRFPGRGALIVVVMVCSACRLSSSDLPSTCCYRAPGRLDR